MDAGTDRHSGSSGLWARFSESDFQEHRRFLASEHCNAEPFEKLHLARGRRTALYLIPCAAFNPVCRSLVFILFDEFRRDSAILEVAMYGGIAHFRERLALSVQAPVPQQFRLASRCNPLI
jgi:hypothetical protein